MKSNLSQVKIATSRITRTFVMGLIACLLLTSVHLVGFVRSNKRSGPAEAKFVIMGSTALSKGLLSQFVNYRVLWLRSRRMKSNHKR